MKYGVGIDVSKGKSTIAILSTEGEIIEEPFFKEITKGRFKNCNGRNWNISFACLGLFT